jgi:hypothetical protein
MQDSGRTIWKDETVWQTQVKTCESNPVDPGQCPVADFGNAGCIRRVNLCDQLGNSTFERTAHALELGSYCHQTMPGFQLCDSDSLCHVTQNSGERHLYSPFLSFLTGLLSISGSCTHIGGSYNTFSTELSLCTIFVNQRLQFTLPQGPEYNEVNEWVYFSYSISEVQF